MNLIKIIDSKSFLKLNKVNSVLGMHKQFYFGPYIS